MSGQTQDAASVESVAAAPVDTYSSEELSGLTKALSQVVLGASMSEKTGGFGLMREIMAAMKASAVFVGDSSNPLLKQIVSDAGKADNQDDYKADESPSAEQAVEDGIAAAKRSHALLIAKGKDDDADAWAQLLLTAANAAVEATKTGGFLGFGGERVTPSEQAYIQRLADTLGYKKEP